MKRALTLIAVTVLLAGCADHAAYENQPIIFGNPTGIHVKPTLLAIHVQYIDTGGVVPSNAECGIGLLATGIGVIFSIANPPAGVVAWSVFGASSFGLGYTLADCTNQYHITRPAWEVITQCPVNHLALTSTFDDWGAATAFINMGSCFCSLSCQFGFEDWDAPGIPFSQFAFTAGRNYWHDGANRIEGPVTDDPPPPPPPPDFHAIADSMGIEYTGCDGVGVFQQSALTPAVCQ